MTKLTLGKKPIDLDIPFGTTYHMIRIGDYIEIDIEDPTEITKLKAKGFK